MKALPTLALIAFVNVAVATQRLASGSGASNSSHDGHPQRHQVVPTYGWRRDDRGHFIDIRHPAHEKRRQQLRHFPPIVRSDSMPDDQSLRASPSQVANGGQVTVEWSGVQLAKQHDWIGLYCPSDANAHEYLEYWFVNVSPTYREGRGNVTVRLWNMRTDCQFRYYGNDTYTELIAQSNIITFDGGKAEPLQAHVALGNGPSQMRVQWVSGVTDSPYVQYGLTMSSLSLTAKGTFRTYTGDDLCGPPANSSGFHPPGYIHDVLLTDLKPNTTYYYRYGSNSGLSKIRQFLTAPETLRDTPPFQFIVYADMGSHESGATTASLALKEVNDGGRFILHPGDISYAVGHAYIWEQWQALIEPYATQVPYMVGIGNHEQDHTSGGTKDPSKAPGNGWHPEWGNFGDDSGGECGVPMYYRFHMPDNGNALWWYSFDYGNVHIIMMSTEHNYTAGSPQYQWMEDDLQKVDRKVTPWLILAGHRPMYSSERYPGDYKVCVGMQEAFEDLLMKYKVDLALWGHYHSYERTCPVYKDECHPEGTTHIVIGSAGASLDHAGLYNKPWSKFFDNEFGLGRITVQNSSAMLWEYIRNKDGGVHDHVWFLKNPNQ